jgi:hypothetical protein
MEEKMKSLVAAVFAAGLACSATADVRIGVIDMMSLIKEHPSYEINKKLWNFQKYLYFYTFVHSLSTERRL